MKVVEKKRSKRGRDAELAGEGKAVEKKGGRQHRIEEKQEFARAGGQSCEGATSLPTLGEKVTKKKAPKRPEYNPEIGYHLVDWEYRVIGFEAEGQENPAYGSREKAKKAARRYGREAEVREEVGVHVAGIVSAIFNMGVDIQMDGESALKLVKACERNGIETEAEVVGEIRAEEEEAIYSSRRILKG